MGKRFYRKGICKDCKLEKLTWFSRCRECREKVLAAAKERQKIYQHNYYLRKTKGTRISADQRFRLIIMEAIENGLHGNKLNVEKLKKSPIPEEDKFNN